MSESERRAAFAELLRRHRRAAGLSQRELARRAGYSPDYVSMLERAVRAPAPATLGSLADALDLLELERMDFQRAGAPTDAEPGVVEWLPAGAALVGRSVERDLVDAFVQGDAPALLFLGDVGIGKTRLLEEGRRLALEHHLTALSASARTPPSGSAWPYAPLVEAVANYAQTLSTRRLRAVMRGCEWLVRVIPELRERDFEAPQGRVPAAEERRHVFQAVKRFLTQAAGGDRPILIVDDMHWAAADGLDLIAFLLAPPYRVRLLGAYRPAEVAPRHPLAALCATLLRQAAVNLVRLGPLAPDAARQMLASLAADVPLDAAQVAAIGDRTDGVPLYIACFARALRTRACTAPWSDSLPVDLVEIVRQHLARLSRPAHEVLAGVAALAPEPARCGSLQAVTRLPEAQVLDAIDGLLGFEVLEEYEFGAYRFQHELVRDVVRAGLSGARYAGLRGLLDAVRF